jgi:hypothetical protein
MQLASKFNENHSILRMDVPLTRAQMHAFAPSIFAECAHGSRSERYAYIPTSEVLRRLQIEGFSPFMVCQSRSRDLAKREHTKHMVRLRHASQITGEEANEIILVNSHDGSSAYQMLAGVFRFVCSNGMVCGTTMSDVRVRHNGDVVDNVIEGAFRVVEDFVLVDEQKRAMKDLWLTHGDQVAFAKSARALKYDDPDIPPPITEHQLLHIERPEDNAADLWTTFNRVQEHLMRGGIRGRRPDGRRATTRGINAIDQNVKINRALWILAEAMRELKDG